MAGVRAHTCVHKENTCHFLEITCEKSYENKSEALGIVSMSTISFGCIWCSCVCLLKREHRVPCCPTQITTDATHSCCKALLTPQIVFDDAFLPNCSLAILPRLTVSDSEWKGENSGTSHLLAILALLSLPKAILAGLWLFNNQLICWVMSLWLLDYCCQTEWFNIKRDSVSQPSYCRHGSTTARHDPEDLTILETQQEDSDESLGSSQYLEVCCLK